MNKIFFALIALTVSTLAWSQGYEDVLRFNRNDVGGTARSQAMGGAFGALGADMTSMVINPAGMAVLRATELSFTLGVNAVNCESNYYGYKAEDSRTRVPLSQLGICWATDRSGETGLVGSNFFVGYTRLADFNNKEYYGDPYAVNSLLDYFCTDEQKYASLTGGLAYDAYLTNDATLDDGSTLTYNVWEDLNDDGTLNPNFRLDENGLGIINMRKRINHSGAKSDITFGYAGNISNKVYFGGTIAIQKLSFEESIGHYEYFEGYLTQDEAPDNFSYLYTLQQEASGVNFKLGVIVRPLSALRVGISLHSPGFYRVNETCYSDITNTARNTVTSSKEYDYEYRYHIPSRLIVSVAGVASKVGVLSLDYEHSNYKRSKFKEIDDSDNIDLVFSEDAYTDLNNELQNNVLCGVHTLRLGAELSMLQPFYARAGFRMTTPGIKEEYYYNKPVNMAVSGGVGVRLNNFYADLSYVADTKKTDSYVLPDTAEGYLYETNKPALLTQKSRCGLLTIGFRF